MFSAFGSTLLAPILPVIVYSLASITQPTLINHVIIFVESYQTGNATDREPVSHGWGLVGAYALIFLTSTLSWSMFQMSALRCSVAMRGLLVQMIYQKALRIHQDTAKEVGAGSSTSLMSVDVERIVAQCEPFHLLYSALIMVLIGFVILYNAVGISFVTPIIVAVLFIASIPVLTRRIPQRQKNWSRCTDLRVKLFNSAVRNIKAVKMSGYEDIMIDKLQTLRGTEVGKQLLFYRDMLLVSASKLACIARVRARLADCLAKTSYQLAQRHALARHSRNLLCCLALLCVTRSEHQYLLHCYSCISCHHRSASDSRPAICLYHGSFSIYYAHRRLLAKAREGRSKITRGCHHR